MTQTRDEPNPRAALLVDYGGVLTTSIRASFSAFCRAESITGEQFMRAVFTGDDSPVARVEVGALSPDDFDVEVAERLSNACGRTIDGTGLKARLFAQVRPDEPMRTAVRTARGAGIPTVLVSNSWGGDDYPMDELAPLFDHMLISGHIGMRKPDPDIYLEAAARAGVAAAGCVFVDDLEHNVDGATAVGMTGVLHRDADATIPRLEALLGLPLREGPR